jgi:D-alanyl-D-alanine carboxypeptidase
MTRTKKGNETGWRRCSQLFCLMIVFGLFMISCTSPSSAGRQVTRPPETIQVENTPAVTQTAIEVTYMPASTPTTEPVEETSLPFIQIDELMNELVNQAPLAGIALGVQYKEASYTQGYGLADIAGGTPVTAQTVFKIASLTKAITAAAILHLSEEGRVSLDDPISSFIPETPTIAKDIRVRHLLNHTSGLPDWSIDKAPEVLPENFTTAQAVEYYFSTVLQLEFGPGEAWSYSNIGYFLLGAIIENVSGMTYAEYFQVNFFEPLALHSFQECSPQLDALAVGYHFQNKQFEIALPSDPRLAGAAAGLCSHVADLLTWQIALTHAKVIPSELWVQMITPIQLSDGRFLDYGFGVSVQETAQGSALMHEGATAGFNSFFIYYPQQDLNIVLLTNTDGPFDSHLRAMSYLVAEKVLQTP